MPFQIKKDDIRDIACDVIINPTDTAFSGRTGLDARIHRAAGPELDRLCRRLGTLAPGEAVMTRGCDLGIRGIVHVSVPLWTGRGEELDTLRRCYRNALRTAAGEAPGGWFRPLFGGRIRRISLPLIGTEPGGFPEDLAMRAAGEEITAFIAGHDDLEIMLFIPPEQKLSPEPSLLTGLQQYIRSVMPDEREERRPESREPAAALYSTLPGPAEQTLPQAGSSEPELPSPEETAPMAAPPSPGQNSSGLHPISVTEVREPEPDFPGSSTHLRPFSESEFEKEEGIYPLTKPRIPSASRPDAGFYSMSPEAAQMPAAKPHPSFSFTPDRGPVLDESFSQMVLRKIEEKGFRRDSDCYSRANIDRRLFSKIRSDVRYHPRKVTAVALAVALELPLDETKELLEKAGYSLSHSILFDVIVEYCIIHGHYDIFEINELLFRYDQPLLGA